MSIRSKYYMLLIGFCIFSMLSMAAMAMDTDTNSIETDWENVITESDAGGGDITSREVALMFILGGAAFVIMLLIALALSG